MDSYSIKIYKIWHIIQIPATYRRGMDHQWRVYILGNLDLIIFISLDWASCFNYIPSSQFHPPILVSFQIPPSKAPRGSFAHQQCTQKTSDSIMSTLASNMTILEKKSSLLVCALQRPVTQTTCLWASVIGQETFLYSSLKSLLLHLQPDFYSNWAPPFFRVA